MPDIDPQMAQLLEELAFLRNEIATLKGTQASFPAPTLTQSHAPEPKVHGPSIFTGKRADASEFILKCELVFTIQHRSYPADSTARPAYAINLLSGDAFNWIRPHLTAGSVAAWTQSWTTFRDRFLKDFGDGDLVETSRHALTKLRQTGSATLFAIEFRRHAAYLNWGDQAFLHLFFDGLKDDVKDRILDPNSFKTLSDLIDEAIKWDNLLFHRRKATPHAKTTPATTITPVSVPRIVAPVTPVVLSSSNGPVPMELDASGHLQQSEKDRRKRLGLCSYCGGEGHIAVACPNNKNKAGRLAATAAPAPAPVVPTASLVNLD